MKYDSTRPAEDIIREDRSEWDARLEAPTPIDRAAEAVNHDARLTIVMLLACFGAFRAGMDVWDIIAGFLP